MKNFQEIYADNWRIAKNKLYLEHITKIFSLIQDNQVQFISFFTIPCPHGAEGYFLLNVLHVFVRIIRVDNLNTLYFLWNLLYKSDQFQFCISKLQEQSYQYGSNKAITFFLFFFYRESKKIRYFYKKSMHQLHKQYTFHMNKCLPFVLTITFGGFFYVQTFSGRAVIIA